jgi:hypothetical protein
MISSSVRMSYAQCQQIVAGYNLVSIAAGTAAPGEKRAVRGSCAAKTGITHLEDDHSGGCEGGVFERRSEGGGGDERRSCTRSEALRRQVGENLLVGSQIEK